MANIFVYIQKCISIYHSIKVISSYLISSKYDGGVLQSVIRFKTIELIKCEI